MNDLAFEQSGNVMPGFTADDVRAAAARIAGAVVRTPTFRSQTLSAMTGAEIYLKFENHQFTAAYKERGALNAMLMLSEEDRKRGVIAASAGNHSQGLSYHGTRLGIPVTIVMPRTTPMVKVMQTESVGGTVVLEGENYDEAYGFARSMQEQLDLNFIHPFDDPHVAAGQGTVALELLEDVPDIDVLALPIGGGGLASGMGTMARAIKPDIGLIGVQAELYPSMFNLIKHSYRAIGGDTLAEGIAVFEPGKMTSRMLKDLLDDIVLVSEPQLENALALLLQIEKTVVEGAGAAGLAAVLANPEMFAGKKVGIVLCGGNIDTRLLAKCAAARSRPVWPSGASSHQDAGPARIAVQGCQGFRHAQRQYHRGLAPAHLHQPSGEGPGDRHRMRSAGFRTAPRAHPVA